jgi:hypothetical protein
MTVGYSGSASNFGHCVAFAGGEEEIGFEAVLAGVEVVVTAAECEEHLMIAALDDAAAFDYEDLIGAADGREPVGDHEGSSAEHELIQALLDHGFGFGVERTGGFVENQYPRLRKERRKA